MNNGNLPAHPQAFAINDVGDVESSNMYEDSQGLTKREYFAGLAMQGYISGQLSWTDGLNGGALTLSDNEAAKEAVAFADALLKELDK